MNTIHKFPLFSETAILQLPTGARILHVHQQHGVPTLWVSLNTDVTPVPRMFVWVGTGNPAPDHSEYIGTAHCEPFVWHIFEVRTI